MPAIIILLGLLVAVVVWHTLTVKEYKEEIKRNKKIASKAYNLGYEQGLKSGKLEAMLTQVTPNKIREAFGFESLTESMKKFKEELK